MEKNNSSKWSWIICNLPLKQFLNGENIIWSLQPSITLSHPSGEGPDPQIKILLDQEKSFQYTEELGWNWHKSWKLPTLSLQLDITDSEKGDTLLCPKDIYVHIFAVKALVDSNNKLCLTDVGLRGTNKMELVDGKVVFQTLKFASTSYNNEGVKFHLLMCIYLQISEDTKPKILKAIISPPIFVDSRKSVRDNDKLNENKLFLYIEPFYPDNFTRKFVKKETKKKESVEEEIQNTPDGLFSYLTAPNIRNKVKHPIFLCVRFSNCISLFFNPDLVSEDDRENLTEFLQNLLLEDIEKGQEQADSKVQDSYFVLYINKNDIEDKLKKKKILELLCPIKYKSLSVVVNKAEIPPNFVQIQDLRWLMELYSKTYSKLLVKSKFCLRGEEDADDEDGPSDRIPPPERQTIGFTQEVPRTQNEWSKYFDTTAYEEDPQKRMKSEDSRSGPINMMEARTISYRESMSKLFPNGQDPASSANPMMNFPGAKANNPLLGNVFPGKGGVETSVGGMQQLPRGAALGVGAMSGMNPAVQNLAAAGGRFPAPTGAGAGAGRGQNFGGMDPMMMLMMQQQQKNKFNQLNQMNQMSMMGQMGQRGQQFPAGMANYQQMMRQFQPQMYDAGVKAETVGDASEINVKVAADEGEEYSEEARRNNSRRGNDINVKDEESMG